MANNAKSTEWRKNPLPASKQPPNGNRIPKGTDNKKKIINAVTKLSLLGGKKPEILLLYIPMHKSGNKRALII